MICDSTGQAVGEISVISMKGQERHDRSVEIFNILGLGLLSTANVGFLLLGETFGGSLGGEVARMRSMVAAGAHTPLEKTFRPFFSATTQ